MLMEGLFFRTFFCLLRFAIGVVCILKQTRDKCHITVKATHRLLSIEDLFIRTLQSIKKKAPYYCKEDKSSMLMEGLFFRTFFCLLRFAIGVVCILKQTRDKCHITVKATHSLLNIEDLFIRTLQFII